MTKIVIFQGANAAKQQQKKNLMKWISDSGEPFISEKWPGILLAYLEELQKEYESVIDQSTEKLVQLLKNF